MCLAAKFPALMCFAFQIQFKLKRTPDVLSRGETIHFLTWAEVERFIKTVRNGCNRRNKKAPGAGEREIFENYKSGGVPSKYVHIAREWG